MLLLKIVIINHNCIKRINNKFNCDYVYFYVCVYTCLIINFKQEINVEFLVLLKCKLCLLWKHYLFFIFLTDYTETWSKLVYKENGTCFNVIEVLKLVRRHQLSDILYQNTRSSGYSSYKCNSVIEHKHQFKK